MIEIKPLYYSAAGNEGMASFKITGYRMNDI